MTTTTTEIKVDVPLSADASNGLVASDEVVEEQIEQAKQLVESLKESGALAELAESTTPVTSTKRALEIDEDDEEPLPTSGTLADFQPKDTRGFFGKIFKKAPRRVPVNAGRVIKAAPASTAAVAVAEEKSERRWVAAAGLVVAVGATAAAPFLFG